MFDSSKLLGYLLHSGLRQQGGIGVGSKALLGMGALGVAWAAFEHFSEQQPSSPTGVPPDHVSTPRQASATPPPLPSAAPPSLPHATSSDAIPPVADTPNDSSAEREESALLIRAMIAAANSDGKIDANERVKILRAATNAGIDEPARKFLEFELDHPHPADELAQIALSSGVSAELPRQMYAASLAAIHLDHEAEKNYLQRLASQLRLDQSQVANIHREFGVA